MRSTKSKPAGRNMLICCVLAGLAVLTASLPARAGPVAGKLFFTTFAGGNNIHSVNFSYNGSNSFTLGSVNDIAATPGADGLTFTTDNFLAVGGQGNVVHKVNPNTGAFTK